MRNLRTSGLSQRCTSRYTLKTPSIETLLPSYAPITITQRSARRAYATSASEKRSNSTQIQTQAHNELINAPLTTLPAPIETPVQAPGQNKLLYLISIGKTYIKFYKTGLLNIKNNFVAAQPLQDTIAKSHNGSVLAAARANALSRSDFQLVLRNKHDIKRVPMFGLVMLICGEFTPLVVIAVSNVVPWTCRIPKQINKDRSKLEERRSISFRNLTLPPPEAAGVQQLHRMQALHINWSLGLSSRMWDWLGGQLPGLPTGMLKRKVAKRVEYLEVDDALIEKHGGVGELSVEEVKLACVERGIDILSRSEKDIRADLAAWIESTGQAPYERLMLTRPSQWPTKGAARPAKS